MVSYHLSKSQQHETARSPLQQKLLIKMADFANREYVRWDVPGVEEVPPNEVEDIQKTAEMFNGIQCYYSKRNSSHCFGGTHARTQGIVKGKLIVPDDLPPHLKQTELFQKGRQKLRSLPQCNTSLSRSMTPETDDVVAAAVVVMEAACEDDDTEAETDVGPAMPTLTETAGMDTTPDVRMVTAADPDTETVAPADSVVIPAPGMDTVAAPIDALAVTEALLD